MDLAIQNQLKSKGQLLLSYRHSGSLPAGTQFSLTGADLQDKAAFYLYELGSDGQTTLVQEGLAVSGNTLCYPLSHCSNHLLRTEKFAGGDAPQTGDRAALPLSLAAGSGAALASLFLFCRKSGHSADSHLLKKARLQRPCFFLCLFTPLPAPPAF